LVRWREYTLGTRRRIGASRERVSRAGRRVAGRARRAGGAIDRRVGGGLAGRLARVARNPRRAAQALLDPARGSRLPWPLPSVAALVMYLLLLPLVVVALVLLVLCTPFALAFHLARGTGREAGRAVGLFEPGDCATLPHRLRRRLFRAATGIDFDALDTPAFDLAFRARADELIADFARRFPDRPDQLTLLDMLPYRSVLPLWAELFRRYDAIEAYATDPIIPMLCGHEPCVAYEHGTIREIPFDDAPTARLCALAYARADAVVVTNPDCRAAADRLGVRRLVPIPHLIDRKYYDPEIADAGALPPDVRPPYIFSPARHDWDIKGSHILIAAFARIAGEFPDLQLVTPAWGGDLARSHELITTLGIGHRVAMIDPVNIHNLIRVTRGARALVDQFRFGVFGGIGPTALAVGTPLITHLDHSKSDWWMEPPPYFEAWDEDSCVDALRRALNADAGTLRASLRAWMRRNYWHGQVVDRHAELFAALIDERSPQGTT
jgi:glycosyltransferase involved in cell wall biosynthesis